VLAAGEDLLGGGRQQGRLADAGFAADDQRLARPLGEPADEVGHDLELDLTPVEPAVIVPQSAGCPAIGRPAARHYLVVWGQTVMRAFAGRSTLPP
jgi:hypothetical protein